MKRNEIGFIIELDMIGDKDVHNGSSVCNICGKIMSGCWDVVCKGCNKTFCYNHATAIDNYWYCNDCENNTKEKI